MRYRKCQKHQKMPLFQILRLIDSLNLICIMNGIGAEKFYVCYSRKWSKPFENIDSDHSQYMCLKSFVVEMRCCQGSGTEIQHQSYPLNVPQIFLRPRCISLGFFQNFLDLTMTWVGLHSQYLGLLFFVYESLTRRKLKMA